MAQTNHRSTSRVLDIFDLLSNSLTGYTLTEIAQVLDAPKSSILPILQTLASRGYVDIDYRTNRYTIGIGLYVASSIYRNKISANQFINYEMQYISNHINESCCFAIRDGRQTLFLHRTDSKDAVFCSKMPGTQELGCLGAMGKALLCDYLLDDLISLFVDEENRLPAELNLYRAHIQMEETRITRLAYEYGEVEPGIQCIATPIRVNKKIVASLGIILPTFRLSPQKSMDSSKILLTSAQKIENVLETTDPLEDVLSLSGFKNLG